MPNIANILKTEISRVARKEVRAAVQELRKAVTKHRSEIAALKRRNEELERQLRQMNKRGSKLAAVSASTEEAGARHRFSAKGLASQRRKLGLAAEDFGLLIGVSGQSTYKWESGEVHPRSAQLAAIAAVRRVGKRVAAARIGALRAAA